MKNIHPRTSFIISYLLEGYIVTKDKAANGITFNGQYYKWEDISGTMHTLRKAYGFKVSFKDYGGQRRKYFFAEEDQAHNAGLYNELMKMKEAIISGEAYPKRKYPPLVDITDRMLKAHKEKLTGIDKEAAKILCEHFGITEHQLFSRDRSTPVIFARHVYAYWMRYNGIKRSLKLLASLTTIQRRDHTSIINAINMGKDLVDTDDNCNMAYKKISHLYFVPSTPLKPHLFTRPLLSYAKVI